MNRDPYSAPERFEIEVYRREAGSIPARWHWQLSAERLAEAHGPAQAAGRLPGVERVRIVRVTAEAREVVREWPVR